MTHGGKPFRPVARSSKLAAVAMVSYSFAAMVVFVGALAIVAFSPHWSADIAWGRLSLDNFRELFAASAITGAIWTSVTVSLLAVAIAAGSGADDNVTGTVLYDFYNLGSSPTVAAVARS